MLCIRKMFSGMMNYKKAQLLCLMVLSSAVFSVYMVFFNHGPPEEILAANRKKSDGDRIKRAETGDKGTGNNIKDMDNDLFVESLELWKKFIKTNNYISIGDIYDNCDEGDRILVGTVIMIPDKEFGGVKSRSFLNVTFDSEFTGGEFYLEVKYNNQALYDNHWDVCTLDDEEEDRMIFCPYKANSFHSWVKDRRIPSYLPKGRYYTKGWITNQKKEIVICAISDFVL